jgi:hypothetical protein
VPMASLYAGGGAEAGGVEAGRGTRGGGLSGAGATAACSSSWTPSNMLSSSSLPTARPARAPSSVQRSRCVRPRQGTDEAMVLEAYIACPNPALAEPWPLRSSRM